MSARPPPVAVLALAFAGGTALPLLGAALPAAFLLLALLLLPVLASGRPPGPRLLVLALALAGAFHGEAHVRRAADDCRLRLADGPLVVRGHLETPAPSGAEPGARHRLPFEVRSTDPEGCAGRIRAVFRSREGGPPPAGRSVRLEGRWRRAPAPDPLRPGWAGELDVERWELLGEGRAPDAPVLRIRAGVQERLRRLLPGGWPLAEALVLARREALDASVRDAFAGSGTAHLLAISGFHVGVIAGLLLTLLRGGGLERGRAVPLSVAGAWAYVGAIGAPDAAVRACAMLSALALGRALGRKVAPLGALGSAFLLLLVADPSALSRAGFQLSFAGAAGLAVLAPPIGRGLERLRPRSVPPSAVRAVAAGVAATVATAPLVAWHFGRVAPAGVPATLLAAPLVTVAIPALLGLLVLDLLPGPAAAFLGGGVEWWLRLLVGVVEAAAAAPGASFALPRPTLLAACGAVLVAAWAWARERRDGRGTARRRARGAIRGLAAIPASGRLVPAVIVGGAVLVTAPALPPLVLPPTLEVVVLDVGQGDAILLRSPRNRWVLVDAGPRGASWDAGERRVLPYLRRRGVSRLEALVLTHSDLDHIGGAPAVLAELEVGAVVDPARVSAKTPWLDVLLRARARGVGWARAGDAERLSWDGIELEVLHPPPPGSHPGAAGGVANDDSVVLLLRWGRFRALLTGDAPAEVEAAVLGRIEGPVQLLKVGHHGSLTSTSVALLEHARPELALVPVGRGNRYGHPHPRVLARLHAAGARVLRTDRDGTIEVRVREDGSWRVRLPDRPGGLRSARGPSGTVVP